MHTYIHVYVNVKKGIPLLITSKLAPTASAKSVLLIINKSDCVIPGPPFLGILSPPAISIMYMV